MKTSWALWKRLFGLVCAVLMISVAVISGCTLAGQDAEFPSKRTEKVERK